MHQEPRPVQHSLGRDAPAFTGRPGLAVHHLDNDPAAAQQVAPTGHQLGDDESVRADMAKLSHALKDDAALTAEEARREHALEADDAVGTPGREHSHVLGDDSTTAAGSSAVAHGLDVDAKVDEKSGSPDTRHGLRPDKELRTKLPVRTQQAPGGQ